MLHNSSTPLSATIKFLTGTSCILWATLSAHVFCTNFDRALAGVMWSIFALAVSYGASGMIVLTVLFLNSQVKANTTILSSVGIFCILLTISETIVSVKYFGELTGVALAIMIMFCFISFVQENIPDWNLNRSLN